MVSRWVLFALMFGFVCTWHPFLGVAAFCVPTSLHSLHCQRLIIRAALSPNLNDARNNSSNGGIQSSTSNANNFGSNSKRRSALKREKISTFSELSQIADETRAAAAAAEETSQAEFIASEIQQESSEQIPSMPFHVTTAFDKLRRNTIESLRRRGRQHRESSGPGGTRRVGGGDYRDARKYGFEPAFKELELGGKEEDESSLSNNKKIIGSIFNAERSSFVLVKKAFLGFVVAYLVFPMLARFLWRSLPPPIAATPAYQTSRTAFAAASLWQLRAAVSSGFAPAVGTLYGTMQAFTISLLTERIRRIQETVGQEVSTLSLLTRHSIDLYKLSYRVDDATLMRALRPLWDHSTTLISKTRGEELLGLVEVSSRSLIFHESRQKLYSN